MNANQAMSSSAAEMGVWEERLWRDLLAYIEAEQVIPVIGPNLLEVEANGSRVLLDRYIATELAREFGLPAEEVAPEPTLNEVACRLLRRGECAASFYRPIRDIVQGASFAPPEPLRQLADIHHFNLFVTITPDLLLEQAIDAARFGGKPETETIAYTPKDVQDLRCEKQSLRRPTVYHLLGKVSVTPDDHVISDEDLLEFLSNLQSGKRPKKLFDELKSNHLLILGGNFSDWLARFFLRALKRERLSNPQRKSLEILADTQTSQDLPLVSFLQHFSRRTRLYRGGGVAFVRELWQRWRERNPVTAAPTLPRLPPAETMPANAIFISYAREDLAIVQALKAGLDDAGLSTWFDFDQLHAGDTFDHKIRENIGACSCFVAVLSRHTEQRHEGYFWREWKCALRRDETIAAGKPFIIPVVVDDIPTPTAVPPRFQELHMTRLPKGVVTPDFVKRMQQIVAERNKPGRE